MRRDFGWSSLPGWLALALPGAMYLASVSPNVAFWDTGEEQTVPWILGMMHPTGFPLFVVAGWLWTHALPVASPAWRIGALCALATAVSARNAYALARLFRVAPWPALATALLFACGDVAWSRGSRAEVHALALAFTTTAFVNAARFARTGTPRAFRGLALGSGLALATHSVAALTLPGLLVVVLPRRRSIGRGLAAQGLALVALCLGLYAYLPLRSALVFAARRDPTLALGIAPGRPYWDYDHPATAAGFVHETFGADFDIDDGARALVAFDRFGTEMLTFVELAAKELGPLALVATVAGIAFVAREEPYTAAGLCFAALLVVPFATNYHALSDIDRWFLPAYWLAAAFAGVGISRLFDRFVFEPSPFATAVGGLVIGTFAFGLFQANVRNFSRTRDDVRPERWVERVLDRTPDRAVLVVTWPYATPLAYAAYVEGRLGGRIVETQWIGDDIGYLPRWIDAQQRPVYAQVEDDPPEIPGYTLRRVDMQEHPKLYLVGR